MACTTITLSFFFHRSSKIVIILLALTLSVSTILFISTRNRQDEKQVDNTVIRREKNGIKINRLQKELMYGRQLKESVSVKEIEEKIMRLKTDQHMPDQLVSPPLAPKTNGYIFIESIPNTPLPNAIPHILTLQCWAGRLTLDVVEPVLCEDQVVTPLHQPQKKPTVGLYKIYDMVSWNDLARSRKGSGLIDIKEVDISRITHVIVVDIDAYYDNVKHKTPSSCMNDSESYRASLHSQIGLTVTQELCLSNKKSTRQILTVVSDFISFLQKQSQNSKVAVIFRKWKTHKPSPDSFEEPLHNCENFVHSISRISPSPLILKDAQRYLNSIQEKSTAIMISPNVATNSQRVSSCFERTLTQFHSYKIAHNTSNTFLALYQTKDKALTKQMSYKVFFQALYRKRYTPHSWTNHLLSHSKLQNEAYLNVLQQVIASESNCLILAGQDPYISIARIWYNKAHFASQTRCVITVRECLES